MSVIIKEIYWQEYDTTTQIRTVRADIICDTIADLPSGGIITNYKLDIGSRAKVIADGSEWEIQSSGSWVRQPSKLQLDLAGYATEQYVDTGLVAKVDTTTYTAGQAAQDAEIAYSINTGAKNLFKNTAESKTYLGVTFTVNDDGTVSLSGTATTAVGVLEIGAVTPPAGSYIISGCPVGGSWSPNPNKYRIRVAKNGSWAGDDTGNGLTVTANGSDVVSLQINSGVGVDTAGLVFKPMIRRAEITDDTYVPYAPTNRELYEMILAL